LNIFLPHNRIGFCFNAPTPDILADSFTLRFILNHIGGLVRTQYHSFIQRIADIFLYANRSTFCLCNFFGRTFTSMRVFTYVFPAAVQRDIALQQIITWSFGQYQKSLQAFNRSAGFLSFYTDYIYLPSYSY